MLNISKSVNARLVIITNIDRAMWDNDILTSKYMVVTTVNEVFGAGISYLLILKPMNSNGSRGVNKCLSREDVVAHFITLNQRVRFKKGLKCAMQSSRL